MPHSSPRPTSATSGRAGDAHLRRALRRARDGVALNADESELLLSARGPELDELCAAAALVRDAGLATLGRPGTITYSPKVFIPVTRLCRDRCHYCTFVTTPAALRREGQDLYLSREEVLQIARDGAALGCLEALFTLGDRPEDRWPQAQEWLQERGYGSTLEYVRSLAIAVLEETGLLPHLNPGVMSWSELHALKPVSVSMGLMLETSSRRLYETPGQVHYGSPDKDPAVRLRTLQDAGRLSIPCTSGILVGIGESPAERVQSLLHLRQIAREFGHLQEIIIQNFRAKPDTALRHRDDADHEDYLATVAVARLLLGPGVRIQIPPNLSDTAEVLALLGAGADDLGGISPLTPDHVNPERPWPEIEHLAAALAGAGYAMRPRLATHPTYLTEPWLDPRLQPHVQAVADPKTGLARKGVRPAGLPWQEPDLPWQAQGRTDLARSIDLTGRHSDQRSDVAGVFGDWDEIAQRITAPSTDGAAASGSAAVEPASNSAGPAVHVDAISQALAVATADPQQLTLEHVTALAHAEAGQLDELVALADHLRRQAVGDEVTYVVNRNLNFTNVCYTGCRFCAFAQRRDDADAFTLSMEQVAQRVREAEEWGATEICMQGGIDPQLPADVYFRLAETVKSAAPNLHLHAFSPMEVVNGARRMDQPIREWLAAARDAGVDSLPGTAAEILDDDVRWVLTKGKLPTATWVEVITTAHELGLPTTSTMMFGHVDHPRHWAAHLILLRDLQRDSLATRSAAFTEFVPLPFVHQQAPLYLAGLSRPGPTSRETLAVHALARVVLYPLVPNIQTSWVKLGVEGTQAMLQAGANDLGGTLMEETISRMAGSAHGSAKTVAELRSIAEGISRPVRQRSTSYGSLHVTGLAP